MTEQTKNEAKAAVQYSYSDDGCAWGQGVMSPVSHSRDCPLALSPQPYFHRASPHRSWQASKQVWEHPQHILQTDACICSFSVVSVGSISKYPVLFQLLTSFPPTQISEPSFLSVDKKKKKKEQVCEIRTCQRTGSKLQDLSSNSCLASILPMQSVKSLRSACPIVKLQVSRTPSRSLTSWNR